MLRYDPNQHYDAHRDYWDPREFPQKSRWTSRDGYWHNRFATVLWYLSEPTINGSSEDAGGDTWFPRARGGPPPSDNWEACDERGLLVPPTKPVLFYSLMANGELDEYSWHCGCRVNARASSPKIAGNTWLWNSPASTSIRKFKNLALVSGEAPEKTEL